MYPGICPSMDICIRHARSYMGANNIQCCRTWWFLLDNVDLYWSISLRSAVQNVVILLISTILVYQKNITNIPNITHQRVVCSRSYTKEQGQLQVTDPFWCSQLQTCICIIYTSWWAVPCTAKFWLSHNYTNLKMGQCNLTIEYS